MKVVYCICYDICFYNTEDSSLCDRESRTEIMEFDLPSNKKEFKDIVDSIYEELNNQHGGDFDIKSINQITTLESLLQLMNFQKAPVSLGLGDK